MIQSNQEKIDKTFEAIKKNLPNEWWEMEEEMKLHHLLSSINLVMQPKGYWILVDGTRSLIELINEKNI